jgi:hypothetical protein
MNFAYRLYKAHDGAMSVGWYLRKSILTRQPVAATRLNYADEYLSESVRLLRERAEGHVRVACA